MGIGLVAGDGAQRGPVDRPDDRAACKDALGVDVEVPPARVAPRRDQAASAVARHRGRELIPGAGAHRDSVSWPAGSSLSRCEDPHGVQVEVRAAVVEPQHDCSIGSIRDRERVDLIVRFTTHEHAARRPSRSHGSRAGVALSEHVRLPAAVVPPGHDYPIAARDHRVRRTLPGAATNDVAGVGPPGGSSGRIDSIEEQVDPGDGKGKSEQVGPTLAVGNHAHEVLPSRAAHLHRCGRPARRGAGSGGQTHEADAVDAGRVVSPGQECRSCAIFAQRRPRHGRGAGIVGDRRSRESSIRG